MYTNIGSPVKGDDDLDLVSASPYNAETPPAALVHAVTPARNVYVRSNFDVPELSDLDHAIVVDGSVGRPYQLTVGELRKMPAKRLLFTMECAGNDRTSMRPVPAGEPWKGGAVSTVEWTGVPLRDVLARAAPDPRAVEVLVEGADRGQRDDSPTPTGTIPFARSLPIDALRDDVLLAFEMNGQPLPPAHGAPVRLVVPGWYGMASVKWVTRIAALTAPYTGYFQTRRYVYECDGRVTPVTRVGVKSVIVAPENDAAVSAGDIHVWGWAWSGHAPVERVELSHLAFRGWHQATVATLGPQPSPHAWVRWQCDLRIERAGRYTLRGRATDAAGNTQPETPSWNRLGYGNNAVRAVSLTVTE